ncbi:chaperonin 10-like protein [Mycena crocata]|nr:chaperonin 10-like protein [Mycena crocata]
MATQQTALAITHKNGPFTLIRRDIPKPVPGEVLVKVEGAALNQIEWKLQIGLYDAELVCREGNPMPFGTDGAGTIVDVGEGITDFVKGDRI